MSRFWDVSQLVVPVQVGGSSRPGLRLKEYILYQIGLENSVPKVRRLSALRCTDIKPDLA
jgi:hypothetical protein